MRVRVDDERCEGHGRCYAVAPELFEPDDIGNAVVIGDGVVPAELGSKARLAAENCPEHAVTVEED
jgi:ferredoxin